MERGLGIRENRAQFSLLVLINACAGVPTTYFSGTIGAILLGVGTAMCTPRCSRES